MEKEPLVSIIIPTYNSEKTLAKCLESIKKQTYKNIEVIVVDRFSADSTIEIAKRYGARIYQLDCERAKAKNFGLEIARGEYIMFVDSDMELNDKVVDECVNLMMSNERIGGIVIPERSVGDGFWIKVRDFERSFYVGTHIESARFFRRSLALSVKGFDEDIVFFEEASLPHKVEKLGYNVRMRIKAEILHHEEDFSLSKWLKKKFYYGKTSRKYIKRYKEYAYRQINIFYRYGLFLRNNSFYSRPLLALGVLILKSLEYISVGVGYLVGISGAK